MRAPLTFSLFSLFSEVYLAPLWPSWHTSQQQELEIERQKKRVWEKVWTGLPEIEDRIYV